MKEYFKKLNFSHEITHAICPPCDEPTMLVSVTRDFYRCITCGADLEQKVNGVISYIPVTKLSQEDKPKV